MARLARLYVPGIPQLALVQLATPLARPVDPAPADWLDKLRDWLHTYARNYRVAVHGWVLLPDRLALLATPPDKTALSKVIQALGRRLAAEQKQGTVFAGRYHSALVQPGEWLLPCLVWLESLPVAFHYVDTPTRWPWSSAQEHVGLAGTSPSLVTDHPDYWHCGNTPFARQANYKAYLTQGLASGTQAHIQATLLGQWALGDDHFLNAIGPRATRRVAPAPRGRPRKRTSTVQSRTNT